MQPVVSLQRMRALYVFLPQLNYSLDYPQDSYQNDHSIQDGRLSTHSYLIGDKQEQKKGATSSTA